MRVVIIGASHSGLSAAIDLKRLDPEIEVLLIDQQKKEDLGYISNGINLFYQGYIKKLEQAVTRFNELVQRGIILYTETRVTKIEPQKKTLKYQKIGEEEAKVMCYDRLILATGSSPQHQRSNIQTLANVINYKNRAESQETLELLKKAQKVAIIGGGYIGVELADVLIKNGKEVHLIDSMDDILFRYFDPVMVQDVEKAICAAGVHYHPQEFGVQFVTEEDQVTALRLKDETIAVDLVISPKALRPNVALFHGMIDLHEDNTVIVNEYLQTSQPDIYAIGDIVPITISAKNVHVFMPLVSRALRMGRAAALNIAGIKTAFSLADCVTLSKVFGYFLGSCGMVEEEAAFQGIDVHTTVCDLPLRENALAEKPSHFVKAKINYEAGTRKILGIQLLSRKSLVEELNSACMVLHKPLTLDELSVEIFCFSPNMTDRYNFLNQLAFNALLAEKTVSSEKK